MTTDVLSELSNYIATKVLHQPQRVIAADEKIISSGLVDSFHLVDLSLYVEDAFGVCLDVTELNAQTFDTLAQLAAIIETRRNNPQKPPQTNS
jgi:acyl carrier protein